MDDTGSDNMWKSFNEIGLTDQQMKELPQSINKYVGLSLIVNNGRSDLTRVID